MQFRIREVNCRICKCLAITDLPRNDICRACSIKIDEKYPLTTGKARVRLLTKLLREFNDKEA